MYMRMRARVIINAQNHGHPRHVIFVIRHKQGRAEKTLPRQCTRERKRAKAKPYYLPLLFFRSIFFFSSCNISRTLVCLRLACLFRCICGNENDDDDLHQQRAHRMKRMIQLLFSLRSRRVIVFPFFSLNCTTQGLCAGRTQMRTSASASSTASN